MFNPGSYLNFMKFIDEIKPLRLAEHIKYKPAACFR